MVTGRPRRTGQALAKRRHEQIARLALGLDQTAGYSLDDGLRARCRAKLDPGIVKVEIDCPLVDFDILAATSISRLLSFTCSDHTFVRATPASRALMMAARMSKSIGFLM